ncbi:unnamed protein product [Soboliphyme baturini]|uniref:Uncharacterized protein n=1 Tax=Soboliphyme baturini TaxID=241478 RepID=A0A183J7I1_9BILA|nr:unnamed protein product [Soboliphyme baturini]
MTNTFELILQCTATKELLRDCSNRKNGLQKIDAEICAVKVSVNIRSGGTEEPNDEVERPGRLEPSPSDLSSTTHSLTISFSQIIHRKRNVFGGGVRDDELHNDDDKGVGTSTRLADRLAMHSSLSISFAIGGFLVTLLASRQACTKPISPVALSDSLTANDLEKVGYMLQQLRDVAERKFFGPESIDLNANPQLMVRMTIFMFFAKCIQQAARVSLHYPHRG